MTDGYLAHVLIKGEPYLSRANDFRRAYTEAQITLSEFARAHGADAFFGRQPIGLAFKTGGIPDGWTKPKRIGAPSYPKKGTPLADDVSKLPSLPEPDLFERDEFATSISYVDGGTRGTFLVGLYGGRVYRETQIWWAGETIGATFPHPGRAAEAFLMEKPTATITNNALGWEIPDGLVEISKAEVDLIFAQHKVQMERAKSAA